MSLVIDFYSRQPRTTLDCFKANGAVGIARYLVLDPWHDPRALSKAEVDDAHAAGLYVVPVFEMDPTTPGYFTPENGTRDAKAALAHLDLLGCPNDVPFYLAVDVNLDPNLTVPYFNAVDQIIQASPRAGWAGVYGFEAMVEFARTKFGNLGKHLWQTYGTVRGPLDLWQHEQRTICGVSVDLNDCTASGWKGASTMPTYVGQSQEAVVMAVGNVALLEGTFNYPNKGNRVFQKKVYAHTPGVYFYEIRAWADPDADPTEHLDVPSAKFIVTVR